MKKPKLCTVMMMIYHLSFLGGTTTLVNGYLDEIAQLRNEIKTQGDKATKVVEDIGKTGEAIGKSVVKLDNSVKSIEKELKKVKKACGSMF